MQNSANTWLLPWQIGPNNITKLFSVPISPAVPNPLFSVVPLPTINPSAANGFLYCDTAAVSNAIRSSLCPPQRQLAVASLPNSFLTSPSLILGQNIYKVQAKLETKALKAKRPGFSDERYNETTYYIENGLRKVYPYYFTFTTFTKGRWVGEKIIDIFAKEFRANPVEEYERCIKNGSLTVNYEKITPDYRLKHNDLLAHIVHRHETPVLANPLKIIFIDDDIVVLDKPCSLPVHPCGKYRHNTVVFILAKEYNLKNLRTIHRLDRLTSGILFFGRTVKKARELEHQIRNRLVEKQYLCRVEGNFPDDVIESLEPIEVLSYKIGVCKVSKNGKECKTVFKKLSYNGHSSVVLCKPKTGRMHQIRVHLQYLGYPVLNDPLYNHEVFGPNKGKNGDMGGKSDEELVEDLISVHNAEKWLGIDDNSSDVLPIFKPNIDSCDKNNKDELKTNVIHSDLNCSKDEVIQQIDNTCSVSIQTELDDECIFDPTKLIVDENCYECKIKYRDPKPEDLMMYLHAWKYKGPDWEYETKLPEWCDETWSKKQ